MFGRRPLVPLFNKKIRIIVGEPIEFDLPKMTQTAISVSRNFSLHFHYWDGQALVVVWMRQHKGVSTYHLRENPNRHGELADLGEKSKGLTPSILCNCIISFVNDPTLGNTSSEPKYRNGKHLLGDRSLLKLLLIEEVRLV